MFFLKSRTIIIIFNILIVDRIARHFDQKIIVLRTRWLFSGKLAFDAGACPKAFTFVTLVVVAARRYRLGSDRIR